MPRCLGGGACVHRGRAEVTGSFVLGRTFHEHVCVTRLRRARAAEDLILYSGSAVSNAGGVHTQRSYFDNFRTTAIFTDHNWVVLQPSLKVPGEISTSAAGAKPSAF